MRPAAGTVTVILHDINAPAVKRNGAASGWRLYILSVPGSGRTLKH